MEITVVIQSIIIISLMILIGAIISRSFKFNEDTRGVFISLIVNVGMPCIILSSIFNVEMTGKKFQMLILVFCSSIIINLLGIGIGWMLANIFYKESRKKKEIALLSGLGNTGFIGIPLCAVLLGPEGALYAAIFDAGVDFTIWTFGVLILQKNKDFAIETFKSMINVPIIAIVVGLIISYFQYSPPALVINLVNQLAAIAAPLAMFYLGILVMSLRGSAVKKSESKVWLPITSKLIVLPILVSILVTFITFDLIIIQVLIIQSMMPTLTLATILFAKYSADEEIGAVTTVLSTLLALFTIPLLIYLVNLFIL